MKLLTSIGTALGGVIHFVEEPIEEAGKLGKLLATAEKDEPEIRAAALQIVALVEPVAADATADVSGAGLNLASDMKTFQDAAALYAYVKTTFVPLVKSVYGDFKADLANAAPGINLPPTLQTSQVGAEGAGTAPSTAAVAQKGPGLAKSVAA